MRKILFLPIVILLVAGCVQEQPTGRFLQNDVSAQVCQPDLNCTSWSSCIRNDSYTGIQSRTCSDNNNCSSNAYNESRVCGLPSITVKEPALMSLEISDLPNDNNWTVSDKNMISADEATITERERGFEKGYYIHYFSGSGSHLYNYVSVYPLVDSVINMTYSFDSAKAYYKVGDFYENTKNKIASISELANPLVGEDSVAYNITVVDGSGVRKNLYTICFTKWDVADVVTLEGVNISYDFLKDLARKAEAKIG